MLNDGEAIITDRVHGKSVEAIARERGLTVATVESILDREAARALGGQELRRMLFIEARRIEALKQIIFDKAIEGELAAAAIYSKLSERLATMIGLNAPAGHVINVIGGAPEPEESVSSTQQMLQAIRALRGAPEAEGEPEAQAGQIVAKPSNS